jgi:hypothetical protein
MKGFIVDIDDASDIGDPLVTLAGTKPAALAFRSLPTQR